MITVFFIGLALAMDAFSVSVTNGMCIKNVKLNQAVLIALVYAIFQFVMPVTGYFAASMFKEYIVAVDHWIAFILLLFIGIKMISEAIEEIKNPETAKETKLSLKLLTVQGIATSIDALAVGVSFTAMRTPVFSSSALIGAVTFVLCFTGVYIGKKVGSILKGKAEIAGGIILVAIGVKILLEHLMG